MEKYDPVPKALKLVPYLLIFGTAIVAPIAVEGLVRFPEEKLMICSLFFLLGVCSGMLILHFAAVKRLREFFFDGYNTGVRAGQRGALRGKDD